MSEDRFQLILLRHGLTDWNASGKLLGRVDIGLNEQGRAQARAAADALKSFPVRAVFSSPQVRARETAGPIADALGVAIETEPGLDEVWLSQAWQGKTVDQLRDDTEMKRFLSDPSGRSPRIEPIEEVQGRAVAAVERFRRDRAGETVAVVSHGDPLRAIVAYYVGLPLVDFRRLLIENGSVSLLCFNPRGPQLTTLNWRPSLR